MSDTISNTPAAPRSITPPQGISLSKPEEEPAPAPEPKSNFDKIREHLQPLYDSAALLGFAVCDDDGEIVYNETFLSNEGAAKAAKLFLSNCQQMGESGRSVYRLTVEMDDIIVIYHCINDGQGLFILSSDCDLDASAEKIAELAE